MPRPHISMRRVRDVLRLRFGEGLSLREVSASLGIPFTTVSDHARRAAAAGLGWPLPDDLDDAALEVRLFAVVGAPEGRRPEPDWAKIHIELRRPHVTLMLLWHEYKETFPDDGYAYSQFCELYRVWRRHLDVVMRQTHRAGEKLFVDFPGRQVPIYDDKTGEIRLEAELFVAVLGASSYLYAEAFASQELLYWVTGHVHAFEFFEGCPAIVVCENVPRNIFGHPGRRGAPKEFQRPGDAGTEGGGVLGGMGLEVGVARGGQGGHEDLGVKGDLPGALIDGHPVPAVVDVHLGSGVVL